MFMVDDGGTVYLAGDNGGGSEIAYNWMFNMIQQYNGHHVYYDWGGGYHTKIHHNVFWQDSAWMSENNSITTAPMRHVTYNNTAIQSPRSEMYKPFDDDERGVNALWADGQPEAWGIKDWKNRDFTLVAGSRAIDRGNFRADSQYLHLRDFPGYRAECYLIDTPVVIPRSAITGERPDLGAYEYGLPRWIPGHDWGDVVWDYPGAPVGISSPEHNPFVPRIRLWCVLTRSGLTVSVPDAPEFTVRVLDLSGRTVTAVTITAGEGNLLIPRRDLPHCVLVVRVSTREAAQTFTVTPLRL